MFNVNFDRAITFSLHRLMFTNLSGKIWHCFRRNSQKSKFWPFLAIKHISKCFHRKCFWYKFSNYLWSIIARETVKICLVLRGNFKKWILWNFPDIFCHLFNASTDDLTRCALLKQIWFFYCVRAWECDHFQAPIQGRRGQVPPPVTLVMRVILIIVFVILDVVIKIVTY